MPDTDRNYYNLPASGTPGCPYDYPGLNCDPRANGDSPAAYDDLLKVSGKTDVVVRDFLAASDGTHKEDGIDLMRESARVVFRHGTVQAGRAGVAITNKGGNSDCTFEDILIIAPYGKYVDIEDGNWADQSWRRGTGNVYRRIRRADGQPVRYAWGRAGKARLVDGQYRIVWWWVAVLHLYVYGKRLGRLLHLV